MLISITNNRLLVAELFLPAAAFLIELLNLIALIDIEVLEVVFCVRPRLICRIIRILLVCPLRSLFKPCIKPLLRLRLLLFFIILRPFQESHYDIFVLLT